MQITMMKTSLLVDMGNNRQGRVWEGTTAEGTRVAVLVVCFGLIGEAAGEFDLEQIKTVPLPSEIWGNHTHLALP